MLNAGNSLKGCLPPVSLMEILDHIFAAASFSLPILICSRYAVATQDSLVFYNPPTVVPQGTQLIPTSSLKFLSAASSSFKVSQKATSP